MYFFHSSFLKYLRTAILSSINSIQASITFLEYTSPNSKTKFQTTDWIVTKLYTHRDSFNATSHFEFQVDISILETVSEVLATQRKRKIGL